MNHLLPVYTRDRYTRALNDRLTVAGSWISRNSRRRIQLRTLDDSPAGDRRVAVNFVCCTPSNYFLRTTLTNCPPFVGQRSQLIALASSVLIYKCISVLKRIEQIHIEQTNITKFKSKKDFRMNMIWLWWNERIWEKEYKVIISINVLLSYFRLVSESVR